MNMNKKSILTFFVLVFTQMFTFAQPADSVEMADTMRSNGKIYVVLGVVLILLLGFFIYLILLDKKIGKLEKDINSK